MNRGVGVRYALCIIREGYYYLCFQIMVRPTQSAALNSRCRSIQYKYTTESPLNQTWWPPPPPPEMLPIEPYPAEPPPPTAIRKFLPPRRRSGHVPSNYPHVNIGIANQKTEILQSPASLVFCVLIVIVAIQFKTFSRCQQRDPQAISHAFCREC